ncbi:hypothetical protein VCR1J2_410005 [Vibrio coralliirubri]|nr:hypothetical protein VCR1J2_410005 [Vibrio coralliirubri]
MAEKIDSPLDALLLLKRARLASQHEPKGSYESVVPMPFYDLINRRCDQKHKVINCPE